MWTQIKTITQMLSQYQNNCNHCHSILTNWASLMSTLTYVRPRYALWLSCLYISIKNWKLQVFETKTDPYAPALQLLIVTRCIYIYMQQYMEIERDIYVHIESSRINAELKQIRAAHLKNPKFPIQESGWPFEGNGLILCLIN